MAPDARERVPTIPGSGIAKWQRASAPIAQERVRRGTKKERLDIWRRTRERVPTIPGSGVKQTKQNKR